jgi:RNA polymerase sigma-70 factor (ECF subfamily)
LVTPAPGEEPEPEKPEDLGSTADLFRRARAGDRTALNALYDRIWTVLCRVAHGRLPKCARGLTDTQDIVQNAMVNALKAINTFEPQYPGAFLAYMHRCVINEVNTQVRKAMRRPSAGPVPVDLPVVGPSPYDHAEGNDTRELYEYALTKLSEEDQQIIIMRVEMGFSYMEIARLLNIQVNAARMRVARALVRLAEVMKKLGHGK